MLERRTGLSLPTRSERVAEVARAVYGQQGLAGLSQVAKLHLRTTIMAVPAADDGNDTGR